MNYDEGSWVYLDWVEGWYEQLEDWEADVNVGSSMGSWIEYMTEKDVIGSWYVCKTPEAVHEAMSKGHYVWSGSKQINRTATRKAPYEAVYGWGSAHLFALDVSDSMDEEFIWANSYWDDAYDWGRFYTKREDFDKLFTCIAMIDKQDISSIDKIEKRLQAMIEERWQSAIRQLITKRRTDLTHAKKLLLRDKLTSM